MTLLVRHIAEETRLGTLQRTAEALRAAICAANDLPSDTAAVSGHHAARSAADLKGGSVWRTESITTSAREPAGDIYIGVVGPVRTGKSTFIKRFMETMVLPGMENMYKRGKRARDELPQSGAGRTIMTAEPKFVPEEAAEIALPEGGVCRVRLVDCVGYLVEGALGSTENDTPRMVSTPWREEPMTLAEAAEIGTHRVIGEHSTIGLVITTDGSFTDIPRESYIPAERRVIMNCRSSASRF